MTQVKKAYQDIISFLQENEDKKVKTILEQVIALASAKTGQRAATTMIKDAGGNVVAILDYYFKRWMPLVGEAAVEFGAKKDSTTGFNTMCKAGVSEWTKRQREAKVAGENLLKRVANGEVAPQDILAEQAKIEEARKVITETTLGFETMEEVVAYLEQNGVNLG